MDDLTGTTSRIRATPFSVQQAMARLAVLFVALFGTLACSSGQAAPDRKPFQDMIAAALTTEKNSFVPDPPVCPGPVPEEMRQRLIAQLPSQLSAYFGQPQLDKEISIATAAVHGKDGPACIYGGGVDWVRLDSLSVDGTAAAGAGQVRVWARVAQCRESLSLPSLTTHSTPPSTCPRTTAAG